MDDAPFEPSDPTNQGVDVTADSLLPDIPDAGDDSQPISSPDPVDLSTASLTTHAALAAGTLNDGDDRTLYEQTLDAYEQSGADEALAVPAEFSSPNMPTIGRRARIYEA